MKSIATLFSIFFILEFSQAQVFVNQDASGANDGTSWANAYTNLQDALNAANPGNQIWMAQGTYIPEGTTGADRSFRFNNAVELYGGFAGTETMLSEREWDIHQTLLDGDANGDDDPGDPDNFHEDNANHMIIIQDIVQQSIVDGITFTKGATRSDSYAPIASDLAGVDRWSGGGMIIVNSTAIIRNCTFNSNYGYRGSALLAKNPAALSEGVIIENCWFNENKTSDGGACRLGGLNFCQVRKCHFDENIAGSGGALVFGNLNILVDECTFTSNTANNVGAACFLFHNNTSPIPYPTFEFRKCNFTSNKANNAGGAIRFNNFEKGYVLNIDQCNFNQNQGFGSYGGGIDVEDFTDTTTNEQKSIILIKDSGFTGNGAYWGAGVTIVTADEDSLQVSVSNTEFTGNLASQSGGGLAISNVYDSKVKVDLYQVNFNNNNAQIGAGLMLENYSNTNKMYFTIDDCEFNHNRSSLQGGAITSVINTTDSELGCVGIITNSTFTENTSDGNAGAIFSDRDDLEIENCRFQQNYTPGNTSGLQGGGGILLRMPKHAGINKTVFDGNSTDQKGAALLVVGGDQVRLENVLFQNNSGNSALSSNGQLQIANSTFSNNTNDLHLNGSGSTEIQNSIFNSTGQNLQINGTPQITTNGGNISRDATFASYLTGAGSYADLNSTDPDLNASNFPNAGSPAIDAGNSLGIFSLTDLLGNPRIAGAAIDAGSYETFTVATHHALAEDIRMKVSPNPVIDVVQISFDKEIESLRLMMMDGVMIEVDQKSIVSKQINIHDFAPGVYILWLKSGNEWHTARFSKI